MDSEYFSAQIIEATATRPRRVKVCNRKTGQTFERPFPRFDPGFSNAHQLKRFLCEMYTSPLLNAPRFLWYDDKFEMLFYEVIPKE
jgi:hypothetical protein